MKIEIWSDIACPFCYIGKRHLEAALARFPHADQVQVHWRSFELQPEARTTPERSLYEALAESKGQTVAWAKQMTQQVAGMAREAGLNFQFDKTVPANTFRAHRLIHLAEAHGRQDAMKERLLRAYFNEGRNIDDLATLQELAADVQLAADEVAQLFTSDRYAQEVRHDEYQARQINVRGVPFFVFEDKYAVSGAQPAELFEEVLQKVWAEAQPAPIPVAGSGGAACDIDGNC
ncbi:DsbA family oxidoreductase [Hymenobacter weizhouensis]|uniref:DsbA family oxidoreductase n=1 Tax=Hymenobacter sp. YIM 151500-1 TaxID=2987689 RepID=UPI0022266934|nr:DsbA family oxidoreductase [Hymenobacter sp. YIM 151500-1]UYZ62701.1 DsbA family oxidoreductase [Hymenobacter sp. YIM 151500-1]